MSASATGRGAKGEGSVAAGRTGTVGGRDATDGRLRMGGYGREATDGRLRMV